MNLTNTRFDEVSGLICANQRRQLCTTKHHQTNFVMSTSL